MIEIPISKALIAVEEKTIEITVKKNKTDICSMCAFYGAKTSTCDDIACLGNTRKDGKNVIFKLVDYKEGKHD